MIICPPWTGENSRIQREICFFLSFRAVLTTFCQEDIMCERWRGTLKRALIRACLRLYGSEYLRTQKTSRTTVAFKLVMGVFSAPNPGNSSLRTPNIVFWPCSTFVTIFKPKHLISALLGLNATHKSRTILVFKLVIGVFAAPNPGNSSLRTPTLCSDHFRHPSPYLSPNT